MRKGWRFDSERHSLSARRVKTGRKPKMFFHAPLLSEAKKVGEDKGIFMDKSGEVHVNFSKKDFVERMKKSIWHRREEIKDIKHRYSVHVDDLKKQIKELESSRNEKIESEKYHIGELKRKISDSSDASYNEYVQSHIESLQKHRKDYPEHFELKT
jgi:hypothetical protein